MKKIALFFYSILATLFLLSISFAANAQHDKVYIANQKLSINTDSVIVMTGGYSQSFSGISFSFLSKKNTFLIRSIKFNFVDGRTLAYDSIRFKSATYGSLIIQLPSELVLNAAKISQIIIKYDPELTTLTEKNSIQVFGLKKIFERRDDWTGYQDFYISPESGRFVTSQINQIYSVN